MIGSKIFYEIRIVIGSKILLLGSGSGSRSYFWRSTNALLLIYRSHCHKIYSLYIVYWDFLINLFVLIRNCQVLIINFDIIPKIDKFIELMNKHPSKLYMRNKSCENDFDTSTVCYKQSSSFVYIKMQAKSVSTQHQSSSVLQFPHQNYTWFIWMYTWKYM